MALALKATMPTALIDHLHVDILDSASTCTLAIFGKSELATSGIYSGLPTRFTTYIKVSISKVVILIVANY